MDMNLSPIDAGSLVCYHRTHVLNDKSDRRIYSVDEIVLASHTALTHLEELTATADLILDASLAASTRRAYQSDWRQFSA
jgi:hypothetical protein